MSAVLNSIPATFSDKEYLKSLIKSLFKEGLLKELILEDSEIRDIIREVAVDVLAVEYKIPKRLANVEHITGLVDYSDLLEESDQNPTIPEQINALTERIAVTESVKPEKHEPLTVTEKRAEFFIKLPPEAEILPTKEKAITSKSFRYWLKNTLPEELRPKTWQNIRKLKRDVYEKVEKLTGKALFMDKSSRGNRDLLLFMKTVT